MKVLALFQIYLPYFLPRTNEWSAAPYLQHFFDVEGQCVNVHPRKADEELFPNPIDKELAELEVQIQSDFIVPSDAPRTIALRDRCFDRVEAQVPGEVVNNDVCRQPEVTFTYRRGAISACKPLWVAQSGAIRSPARIPIELSVVNASLSANQEPKLPIALLVSAKEKLMVEQLQEGIVCLASGCELPQRSSYSGTGSPMIRRLIGYFASAIPNVQR